jgi:hypothetical protein
VTIEWWCQLKFSKKSDEIGAVKSRIVADICTIEKFAINLTVAMAIEAKMTLKAKIPDKSSSLTKIPVKNAKAA